MKTLLTDYDKLMKDNQSKNFIKKKFYFLFYLELLTRYNETKTILNEYEKNSQISLKSSTNEFPNPQRVKFEFEFLILNVLLFVSLQHQFIYIQKNLQQFV